MEVTSNSGPLIARIPEKMVRIVGIIPQWPNFSRVRMIEECGSIFPC